MVRTPDLKLKIKTKFKKSFVFRRIVSQMEISSEHRRQFYKFQSQRVQKLQSTLN